MTLLGGAGTLAGPTVGALLVVMLSNWLAWMGEWVNFILGAVLVVGVLLFRRGIVGAILPLLAACRLDGVGAPAARLKTRTHRRFRGRVTDQASRSYERSGG